MGKHLVTLLSSDGIKTSVTTRQKMPRQKSVEYIQGNAKNMDFLQQVLLERWDAIVDFMTYKTDEFNQRIDLLLAATDQYVFLSSARVYANSTLPISEGSERLLNICDDKEFLSSDDYALEKARQEDILANSPHTNWSVVRPYITYSEERLQLGTLEKEGWLYRALSGRTIVFSKEISLKKTTLTYGLDVSTAIKAILGNPSTLGEAFHVTAPNTLTWESVLGIYLDVLEKHLGNRPRVLLQDLEPFSKCSPGKNQITYDRLYDREFDNRKIGHYADTSHFILVEKGLKECLEKFLCNPKFKTINWRKEAIKDANTDQRTPLREIPEFKNRLKYLLFLYLTKHSINKESPR